MEQRKILWVDDDPDDLELMRTVLKGSEYDFHVKEASNGKEAIEYLEKAKKNGTLPCLIILDMNMPVMDGREALRKIKEDEQLKKVPIVVFTTSQSTMDRLYCQRYHTEMVTKPFTFDSLRSVVERLISFCSI